MKSTVQIINWKGMPCLQLSSGGYTAWIAPEIGSNVIRLFHEEKGLEINSLNIYERKKKKNGKKYHQKSFFRPQ